MIDELKLQVTEVHSKEFIANPKATLRRLCLTLHIDCSGEYLHTCAERTFASESRSRSLVDSIPHRQGAPQHAEVQTSAEILFLFLTGESLMPIYQGRA